MEGHCLKVQLWSVTIGKSDDCALNVTVPSKDRVVREHDERVSLTL